VGAATEAATRPTSLRPATRWGDQQTKQLLSQLHATLPDISRGTAFGQIVRTYLEVRAGSLASVGLFARLAPSHFKLTGRARSRD